MSIPFKAMIKDNRKKEPVHPCDPPKPCHPCEQEPCDDPKICKERLKNPMRGYDTRCKSGASIGVEVCQPQQPPHPCDPPLPCVPGKPKPEVCPEPAFYLTRIKNPEPKKIRCPSEDDLFQPDLCENRELLKKPFCKTKGDCVKPITINPFDEEADLFNEMEEKRKAEEAAEKLRPKKSDIPEYLFQTTLCKNLDILKKAIQSCFKSPCQHVMVFEPFEYEEQQRIAFEESYEEEKDPCEDYDSP